MRKIASILDGCNACQHFGIYDAIDGPNLRILVCRKQGRLIAHPCSQLDKDVPFPNWCPLETYVGGLSVSTGIVLDSMPHLEWACTNLTGHGGTKANGQWYYTRKQAVDATKEISGGWRLPTAAELITLAELRNSRGSDPKDRMFEDKLLLSKSGWYNPYTDLVMHFNSFGYYWSGSLSGAAFGYLYFGTMAIDLLYSCSRSLFSVRLVREI